ncbi:MAG: cyclic dehypoxanthinyl futalosine synthase [Bacteroidales bacterium]
MKTDKILNKATDGVFLSTDEAMLLYDNVSTSELMAAANFVRYKIHKQSIVTWLIDRNVNYSNVCISGCKFCNFYRSVNHKDAYITTDSEYDKKINELIEAGGNQLLLQGGLHPKLGIEFYETLFKSLKTRFPNLKLHALGPPEIVHISKISNLTYKETLVRLIKAGLDSLPGAGAEILSDRVRKILSPVKASTAEWLDVMHEAHKLNLITSATMMFGHIETRAERIEHILKIRDLQDKKPEDSKGFISFIPWTFQGKDTVLQKNYNLPKSVSSEEYIRLIAMSRLLLPNIDNIQASWLTVGKDVGQVCLHAGANDFGSIMMEENVVSSAGSNHKFDVQGIKSAISEAGFVPKQRNQRFEILD